MRSDSEQSRQAAKGTARNKGVSHAVHLRQEAKRGIAEDDFSRCRKTELASLCSCSALPGCICCSLPGFQTAHHCRGIRAFCCRIPWARIPEVALNMVRERNYQFSVTLSRKKTTPNANQAIRQKVVHVSARDSESACRYALDTDENRKYFDVLKVVQR